MTAPRQITASKRPGAGAGLRYQRDFERAGHPVDIEVVVRCAAGEQVVETAVEQLGGDEVVEAGDDDGEAQAGGRPLLGIGRCRAVVDARHQPIAARRWRGG